MKLVSLKLALKLRELGFKRPSSPCNDYHVIEGFTSTNTVDAPTYVEVQTWLREEKEIIIVVDYFNTFYYNEVRKGYATIINYAKEFTATKENPLINHVHLPVDDEFLFKTYEKALKKGVKCAIKYLENE